MSASRLLSGLLLLLALEFTFFLPELGQNLFALFPVARKLRGFLLLLCEQ